MPGASSDSADVLSTPLISVSGAAAATVSLPQLLALLVCGEQVGGFPDLAARQRGYWWRFLVRCAAKALHEAGLGVSDSSQRGAEAMADDFASLLRGMTPEGSWLLYNPDPARPAFLQPPVWNGLKLESDYSEKTCSFLTALIGSKNFERKVDKRRSLTASELLFALVEFQQGVIYGGSGNYESQITGSGNGKGSGTPFMGVQIGTSGVAETFRHDVATFLDAWDSIHLESGLGGPHWALWTVPWDGATSLPATELDPAFIPMARCVRVGPPADGVFRAVRFRPSSCSRVDDHTGGGDLGDIHVPLVASPKTGAPKVRGTLPQGYDYREAAKLLYGAAEVPGRPSRTVQALSASDPSSADAVSVVMEGIAFEQGKTLGFHRREVPLPLSQSSLDLFTDPDPARRAHDEMFPIVAEAKKAVRAATRILLRGNPSPRTGDEAVVETGAAGVDRAVDQIYLDRLVAIATASPGDEQAGLMANWAGEIHGLAITQFEEASRRLPSQGALAWKRRIEAESYLRRRLRRLLPAAASNDESKEEQ